MFLFLELKVNSIKIISKKPPFNDLFRNTTTKVIFCIKITLKMIKDTTILANNIF